MVSNPIDSDAELTIALGDQSTVIGSLTDRVNMLKTQIQAERFVSVKEKLENNAQRLASNVAQAISRTSRDALSFVEENRRGKMLLSRMELPLCKLSGIAYGVGDKDYISNQDVVFSISIKLPYIEKLPPYTTWIFLDRNQRMAEDQSVVGRRRIYYDQHGSEALICSDSEEELAEPEDEKHEFSEGEDRVLWIIIQEHGVGENVLQILSHSIGCTTSEIQERYNVLKERNNETDLSSKVLEEFKSDKGISLYKSLSSTLDSFDNLFCRRCMLFDCHLHGCSQSLIYPNEKQLYWPDHEEERKPCSNRCFLELFQKLSLIVQRRKECSASCWSQICLISQTQSKNPERRSKRPRSSKPEESSAHVDADIIQDERSVTGKLSSSTSKGISVSEVTVGMNSDTSIGTTTHPETGAKQKAVENQIKDSVSNDPELISDKFQDCKKQKMLSAMDVANASTETISRITSINCSHEDIHGLQKDELQRNAITLGEASEQAKEKTSPSDITSCNNLQDTGRSDTVEVRGLSTSKQSAETVREPVEGMSGSSEWKLMEKELYMKGIEIFGRNSCLISRNLLSGLKTCMEVFNYMHNGGASTSNRSSSMPSSNADDNGKADIDYTDMRIRSRLLRKRGKARKLKYSWKSAGHPSFWKRIVDGKNQSCKQYTPCGCLSSCGKQCPCLHNGTCCEKYCGCSKSCKNRFRGCHCAKSQCRSRQCPCFAAGRECDPDVCRNCWVSCGDGSLGEPPRQGDGQCGNMRLLLRQQQRILLGKSDVAGWGAFLKNSVNKNDYLGEYTGELISHREADKRGKIYDRANSSFLFDLNDQYVLDAYRKGDKLKFANHSSNPNCYAKVILVAGDHRVGIFAKEHIEASEELFYDYRYGPDQAPAWARRPEGSKRDDASISQGRAKKHQSH
ncbi:histone-lysine N-methyltransferase EZA1 isoform X2 [Benincasa hispida]|uniref:histone-lysine N-methyltransferase EZA1 isoform X2 n=1 Tax=Benincasa hispida TaxID=102211 RepID=UPI0019007AB3|nr:histone-lysine N-methyltransferase EZA1 isoform X2 [Benincasa hispida]